MGLTDSVPNYVLIHELCFKVINNVYQYLRMVSFACMSCNYTALHMKPVTTYLSGSSFMLAVEWRVMLSPSYIQKEDTHF